jgi:hypothetical protein
MTIAKTQVAGTAQTGQPDLSAVVSARNEEQNLPVLLREVTAILQARRVVRAARGQRR